MITADAATVSVRTKQGKSLRKLVPRTSHAHWSPPPDRQDPVSVLEKQNETRIEMLVPVRHGRMSESAFTFYRGTAAIMAADLANTPVTGLNAQICGDAHLSNFGFFGSPERELIFDVNDFDETLTGPWEWDVKRLATSFLIAARNSEFTRQEGIQAVKSSVRAYREAMATFAKMSYLDTWYSFVRQDDVLSIMQVASEKKARKRVAKFGSKARSKNRIRDLSKLTVEVNGKREIVSDPPFIVPLVQLTGFGSPEELKQIVEASFESYLSSLHDDRQVLLNRYRPVDIALKVVGVGSVGTRCFIGLLVGVDDSDPLFLQIKEAGPSVLEGALPASPYSNHGQRVVEGQRLMQTASDIFLGWSDTIRGFHYYWRQLKDMKGSVDVERMVPQGLVGYGRLCGWTLARAHARSGDPAAISGYLGSGTVFDEAIASFAEAYAAQNDNDFNAFQEAIKSGRIPFADGYTPWKVSKNGKAA